MDNIVEAFFSLVRSGLWEKDVRLSSFDIIDYKEVYRLAEEQSIVGLVAAGLEHVENVKIPQQVVLSFVGCALQLEKRNIAMNHFINELIAILQNNDVDCLLVKGQGIAQCYERPLWRASGDIDLLLDAYNYEKASIILPRIATVVDKNRLEIKHFAMTIDSWEVELHGTMRSQLGRRIDDMVDCVQNDTFENHHYRVWINDSKEIYLPDANSDVIFVFVHILQHFFIEGVGIRQICDWCRLIWVYREDLDAVMLEKRLRKMGVLTEWKVFSAFVVDYLGMPVEALPLYSRKKEWRRKACRVKNYILETGSFGRNRDRSFYEKYPYFIYKSISFCYHTIDLCKQFVIFPKHAIISWCRMIRTGLKVFKEGK